MTVILIPDRQQFGSDSFDIFKEKGDLPLTRWGAMAVTYDYSVVGLIDDLMADNKWPSNRPGYKKMYEAERTTGQRGVGHFINTASERFAHYKKEKKQ